MISNDIYLAADIKAMDEGCGISTDVLMQNAAGKLFECLESKGRLDSRICILCGKGNNGGDGYALGVLLHKVGCTVKIVSIEEPVSALAIKYRDIFAELNGNICKDAAEAISEADTVVDCIFGFSFKGTLNGIYAEIAEAVNNSGAFVLAADIPSGLLADSDKLPALCVKADVTCTFSAMKLALASYPARGACGEIYIADIGMPTEEFEKRLPFARCADKRLLKLLPYRPKDGHKGSFGTLAALCGNAETCGAAYLACLAALRSGIGIVRLYTDTLCATVTKTKLAEAIIKDKNSADNVLSHKPSALLLGCGCGRSYDITIKELLTTSNIPTVLDADGINCIAGDIQLYRSIVSKVTVTPHPAEMGRLLGISAAEVNADRVNTALRFAKEYGFVTVLKGAATVIASPDGKLCLSATENTGLSKGGSGDVLAGLIASLLAQGMESFEAACLGVYLHGEAARLLAEQKGVYAMLPSELPEMIGQIMYFG